MNKVMKSAQTEFPADVGITLNQAMRVQSGRREYLGSCNACASGVYDTDKDGTVFVTEVQLRGLTFRLCQRCREQLQKAL